MSRAEDVLAFWFEGIDGTDPGRYIARIPFWFGGGPEVDALIREKFGADVARAENDELDDWATTPRGRLALILLLDQFTRNIHRGSAESHDMDPKAQRLTVEGIEAGMDRALAPAERTFFYMPLLHAEDLALQDRAVEVFTRLRDEVPEPLQKAFGASVEQSTKYRAIIAEFGRFPHRNALLGRPSTAEEIEFLKDWAEKARPAIAR